uniref:Mitochondrial transcription rescue factor 1 C-terminal domain-containing protein n=1 Tax=Stomoxys calcitrans TaxID=35570 RepID=A0A1I8P7F9_STOCA
MLKISHIRQLQLLLRAVTITQSHSQLPGASYTYRNDELRSPALLSSLVNSTRSVGLTASLQKYNKKDVESDSDDEEVTEFKDERDSKVVKTKVNSLRADLILKAGLGIARNKVENIFYESRIRVNGKKLQKKSVQLHDGDEIDVIRGFSQQNPSHLVISRVIILAADPREEGFSVQLRRYKSLLIENYPGANAYKSSGSMDH